MIILELSEWQVWCEKDDALCIQLYTSNKEEKTNQPFIVRIF